MSQLVCEECGSRIPPNYVVCDVCGEPIKKDEKEEAKEKKVDSHPGYEVSWVWCCFRCRCRCSFFCFLFVRFFFLLLQVVSKSKAIEGQQEDAADPSTTVWCTVLGKDGNARAVILFDGAVCLMDGS
jgi:hypothetical protein